MRTSLQATIVIAALQLTAFARADEHAGHYRTSFETSEFVPCNSDERWWVDGPALAEVDSFLREISGLPKTTEPTPLQDGRVFVRWSGVRSELGSHGHLGAYDRQFTAERILEIREPSEDDCAPASRRRPEDTRGRQTESPRSRPTS